MMRHVGPRQRTTASRRSLVALGAILAATTLVACSATQVDQTIPGGQYEFNGSTVVGTVLPASGRASAPAFSGTLMDGSRFDSWSLRSRVALINFWGSWCAPCRIETPELQAVYARIAGQGVTFLGVDVKDQRELGAAFFKNVGVTYPSLFDPRGEVALAFRGFPANVVPSTILLDRRGRVAAVYAGAVRQAAVGKALGALLAETER